MKFVILWKNVCSGEKGIVAAVLAYKGWFRNANNKDDIKIYKNASGAKCTVNKLNRTNDGNVYTIVNLDDIDFNEIKFEDA